MISRSLYTNIPVTNNKTREKGDSSVTYVKTLAAGLDPGATMLISMSE
jgi:hypothetical protein